MFILTAVMWTCSEGRFSVVSKELRVVLKEFASYIDQKS